MWLLLQKENGKQFIVNEKSIEKIEKISLGKKERSERKERNYRGGTHYEGGSEDYWQKYDDEFFGFNIYYDDGKKDTKVSILKVGELNEFYEEGEYLEKIIISTEQPYKP
tara:strand:+ start:213 stop:542 length:330 start_codon:yes stop_codon:yes gene_type:complete